MKYVLIPLLIHKFLVIIFIIELLDDSNHISFFYF